MRWSNKKPNHIKGNSPIPDKLFDPDDMPSLFGDSMVSFNQNEVYFYADVDDKSALDFIKALRSAEKYAMKTAIDLNLPIGTIGVNIRINSYGGTVHSGFACMDAIKSCKVPTTTIVEGVAASAATFLSTAGTMRKITPNSFMLIHQLSSGMWGKMEDLEDEMINLKLIMSRIRKVYEDTTKLKKSDIKEILKKDMWWDADKCVECGLVDRIE
jgi:ATP-dependent protease ClpP protease subunit